MLTINRPFYEYRDIYLFIAVGLATFITTFIVLGVIGTINSDQLSQSIPTKEPSLVEASASDTNKNQGAESQSNNSEASTAESRQNTFTGSELATSEAPLQTNAPASQPDTDGGLTQTTPVVVVQQPAPTTLSTPIPNTGGGDESLINLPTNLVPPLPLLGGLVNL